MNKLLIVLTALSLSLGTAACVAVGTEKTVEADAVAMQPASNSVENADVSLKYFSYTYNGNPVTPDNRGGNDEVTVAMNGKRLVKGRDYKLFYAYNDKPGNAVLAVVGIGDYTGSLVTSFPIKPPAMKIKSLSTGKGNVLVEWDKTEGADGYQVLYSTDSSFKTYHSTTVWASSGKTSVNLKNVPEPGEKYYIKLRGFVVGNDGKRYGSYSSVKEKSVLGGIGKITVPTLNYAYRGRDLKPTVTVRDTDGNKLKEGRDYTYTISNCKNVGTATISVKGKGLYTGSGIKKFNVVKANVANASVSGLDTAYAYTGSAVKPDPTLKFKGYKLVKGTDYTVSYSHNVKRGTATIKFTGAGKSFTGTLSKTFKIAGAGMFTRDGAVYFRDSKGVEQTGWQEIDGNFYCFDRITGKLVTDTTINKIKVDKTGKAVNLTDYGRKRIEIMMKAHQKVLELTDPSDTMEEKRLKVFNWEVFEHPYWVWRLLANYWQTTDEWDVLFADDIFTKGRGCCVSDSTCCAFMFLEIGYKNIYVCHDGRHGWFTVNGRLYDPLFAENVWSVNYDADYMDYREFPKGRIRID